MSPHPPRDWLQRLLHYAPMLPDQLDDLLTAVIAHTPRIVAASLLARPERVPLVLSLEGTVLVADVDGFTTLAERFASLPADAGTEELTGLINRVMAILIRAAQDFGGDLLKFGGDAGLLFFQGDGHASRAITAAREVQVAMQSELHEVVTPLGSFDLRVAIGLASGRFVGLGLGDRAGQEFLPVGRPLGWVGEAQTLAPPGRTVAHASTWQAAGDGVSVVPLAPDFVLIDTLSQPAAAHAPEPLPEAPDLSPDERLQWVLTCLDALTPYLAPDLLAMMAAAPAPDSQLFSTDRRLVTVMMVALWDLGDFEPLWGDAAQLTPATHAASDIYVRMRDIIERYDGVINKIAVGPAGPYLTVLFGAPNSHEDDPLRAVLASLDLQALAERPLRIGINTGFVFAGDVGTSERREYTVIGDAVNLAARLMAHCAPGEIWLGPNAARHPTVARRVTLAYGPPARFKGKSEPIEPAIVRGPQASSWVNVAAPGLAGWGNSAGTSGGLVGRDGVLARLSARLRAVQGGGFHLALLHGVAGVGKSALAQALTARAAAYGFAVHAGTAASYGDHSPFVGWDQAWDQVLGSLFDLDQADRSQDADSLLAALAAYGVAPWAGLVAPLLGLDVTPGPEVLALPPEMREMQRQAAILTVLEGAARAQPRLLIFDNAQWLAPEALGFFDVLLDARPDVPLMVLILSRDAPDIVDRWQGREGMLDVPIEGLDADAMQTLVEQLLRGLPADEAVVRWVVERSGGLPMFAIEAVRALVDSGLLRERAGSWVLTGALEDLGLPEVVYALIQSRIDQLSPPDRHLLRAAAVVGSEMTLATLVAAYGEEDAMLVQRRLPALAPFGLVPRSGPEPELGLDPHPISEPPSPSERHHHTLLVFRQPLVREVAYRGLPHRVQQQIHERLAAYLDLHRDRVGRDWLASVAYHAFEAHLWARAVEANMALGRRAARAYLAEQARHALDRVLAAADAGDLAVPEIRYEAHYLLGETLTSFGLYDDALRHLATARQLAQELAHRPTSEAPHEPEDVARVADLDYREAMVLELQGRYGAAMAIVEHGLGLPGIERLLEGARLYLVGADLQRRVRNYVRARSWAARALALSSESPDTARVQVRARAMTMVALLASLERLQDADRSTSHVPD